jgi:hypothetical protein
LMMPRDSAISMARCNMVYPRSSSPDMEYLDCQYMAMFSGKAGLPFIQKQCRLQRRQTHIPPSFQLVTMHMSFGFGQKITAFGFHIARYRICLGVL